jgi:hypothetical protein
MPTIEELEREVARLRKVNDQADGARRAGMDLQGGGSFSLFQAATALEAKVRERTRALSSALTGSRPRTTSWSGQARPPTPPAAPSRSSSPT